MENSNKIVYSNIAPIDPLYDSTGLCNYLTLQEWLSLKPANSSYVYRIGSDPKFLDIDISTIRTTNGLYILYDDCLEGYTVRTFEILQQFIVTHNLQSKFIFLSGNRDVEEEYSRWCKKHSLDKAFEVAYNSNWYYRVKQNVIDFKLHKRPIDKTDWFMCLNNRLHTHRAIAVTYMDYLGLLEKGKVTCLDKDYDLGYNSSFAERVFSFSEKFSEHHYSILEQQAPAVYQKLPLNIDTDNFVFGSRPHDYNVELYNTSLINLVTETYYDEVFNDYSHMFFSEKIWKPIVSKQMFILIGPRYSLKYLKDLGFKTFDKFIDESYDDLDTGKRIFAAIDSLNSAMKEYTVEELNEKTKHIRAHNIKHFMSRKVQDILCKDITKLICL